MLSSEHWIKMRYKILFLPIETKNREFLGKLLTAVKATDRNWLVFLGQAKNVRKVLPGFLPGVYSEISIPEYKYGSHLLLLSQAGHKIVNICEESVTYPDGKDYCDRKVGEKSLGLTEIFFASGKRHAKDVAKFRDINPDQLPITGSNRMDILRFGYRDVYAPMAKEINDRLGSFILVNTNFARCNPHPNYGNRLAGLQKKNVISDSNQVKIWQGSHDYKAKLMTEFMDFIPDLASRSDCKVVVRPHPSENHEVWNNWAEAYKDVLIQHEGSANEWMMAAKATIHNGCTTGLEGFVLERPVIAYVPDPSNDFSKNIANQVSHQVNTKDELLETVDRALQTGCLDSGEKRRVKTGKLKYYIDNVDGPLAAERIVEELDTLDVPFHSLEDILKRATQISSSRTFLFSGCRSFLKKGVKMLKGNNKDKLSKVLQKFPGLAEDEIMESLLIWKQQGLLSTVPSVTKIQDNFFCLYNEK